MPQNNQILDVLQESIHKIQEISKTTLCTVHVGIGDLRLFAISQLSENNRASRIATVDDGRIFAMASLLKPFIAIGVFVMIEKLSTSSEPEHRIFHCLQGALHRTFTEVFNEFSDIKIEALEGNPTVSQLMVHFKGVRNINHLFLAPNGNPLLSDNDFLHVISQLAKDTSGQDDRGGAWIEYSNGNYILLALFIQVVSKIPLREFLRAYVFDHLGMQRMYMTADNLNALPDGILAEPQTVSGNGVRRPIQFVEIPYLADTIEFAVAGGYICAGDFGKLYTALLKALFGQPVHPWFDRAFAESFLQLLGKDDEQDYGYTPCGLVTALHKRLPGSHSLNRAISPQSDYSEYVLGKHQGKEVVMAWYLAGSATGWASTAYFLPHKDVFVICLTDTSGPLDASDIITRLCLQEICDLRPTRYGGSTLPFSVAGWETMALAERHRAYYVELATRIYAENSLAYRELERKDAVPDTPVTSCPNVCGIFVNRRTHQSLHITHGGGGLRVHLKGSKESKPMRFVWKGTDRFRICSLPADNLAIDCFGAWKELEFHSEGKDNMVTCLFRNGLDTTDRFDRESRDST